MQTIVLQKFENPKKVWGVVMWTPLETLRFVDWFFDSIPTVNIFCTFFKSFGLVVKKWVFKLKFMIIIQHDSLQSRTVSSSKSVYNPEESRKLLVCCSQNNSFLLPWWPGLSSHTVNKKKTVLPQIINSDSMMFKAAWEP